MNPLESYHREQHDQFWIAWALVFCLALGGAGAVAIIVRYL